MTGQFYWILKIRNLWITRLLTFVICTLIGAVSSEYLQHIISPFRSFDYFDIVANFSGSLTAIMICELYCYYIHKYESIEYIELSPV